LDAIHSANSSFKKLSASINHTPDAPVESQVAEISNFIQSLFVSKEASSSSSGHHEVSAREPVRIYVDGGFDLIHSGHYNAIRQAKALGDILVVGVNSDAEILKNKGPTVLTCKERADILRACKWVDEVHEDTEYTVRLETLDRYNC
jgi:cytidyltransferase-like protein